MALKDVIIGYAKGDKGDKGDTGERGATGQTGPQGEPGNIADAAITDTQGLDVAKGAKTTAQKLFDAIADRIVHKLVTNDTLTTKLADYLLKSAMSSTNIDSTTNVPTSALVYSLMQDVNNNLSKRFATAASGNTYNSVSDFPTTGSGFGVNTQALTLYAGFVIPEYSRICFMNYGGSPDAAISAVSQSGEIYSAFRSSGTWQNGKVSASKDDLTTISEVITQPSLNGVTFSSWTVLAERCGNMVTLSFNISGTMKAASDFILLRTLNMKYRPLKQHFQSYTTQTGKPMTLKIDPNGQISLFNNNIEVSGFFLRQTISYPAE